MKKIKLTESELADIIENVVVEALEVKKKEWIAEQKKNETALIEEKVKSAVKKILKK